MVKHAQPAQDRLAVDPRRHVRPYQEGHAPFGAMTERDQGDPADVGQDAGVGRRKGDRLPTIRKFSPQAAHCCSSPDLVWNTGLPGRKHQQPAEAEYAVPSTEYTVCKAHNWVLDAAYSTSSSCWLSATFP